MKPLFTLKPENLFLGKRMFKKQHFLHLSDISSMKILVCGFDILIFKASVCVDLRESFSRFLRGDGVVLSMDQLQLPGCDVCHFPLLTGIVDAKSFSLRPSRLSLKRGLQELLMEEV